MVLIAIRKVGAPHTCPGGVTLAPATLGLDVVDQGIGRFGEALDLHCLFFRLLFRHVASVEFYFHAPCGGS